MNPKIPLLGLLGLAVALAAGGGARAVVPFRGTFLGAANSFRVASTPAAEFRAVSERVIFGGGETGGGGGRSDGGHGGDNRR